MKWACICVEMGDVFVVGCVWLCLVVFVCVFFVVLLLASVLASMRWLLCGGDDSNKDHNEICNYKKISRWIFDHDGLN